MRSLWGMACVVAGLTVLTATATTALGQARIDPRVSAVLRGAPPPPWLAHLQRAWSPRPAHVLIELVRPADRSSLAALERTGARIAAPGGQALACGRLVSAIVGTEAALERLRRLAIVARVRAAPPPAQMPLDRSAQILGLEGARGSHRALDDRLGGAGIVLADIDSLIDVYHPDFFRADAGWLDWVDVDGDGALTPGVDAIDLDGDGIASLGETAHPLGAEIDLVTLSIVGDRPPFDPAVDYLYLDLNGNGRRDHGATAGFDDAWPALGEPLFVADDVDRNGRVQIHERVVRLGSSKISAVLVAIDEFFPSPMHVYRRGSDLSWTPTDVTGGAFGYPDTLHASGVIGIAAGGVALPSRRWVGIAPDADVVVAFALDGAMATLWAESEGAEVMLHESANWTATPLDGSDAWSTAIDATAARGVAHACPIGNIGGSRKHAFVDAAGATATLPLVVPSTLPTSFVQVTLHRPAAAATTGAQMREPDGTVHDLSSDTTATLSTGGEMTVAVTTTDRGWKVFDVVLYDFGGTIAPGRWIFEVPSARVHGFVADDVSGFGPGVAWDASVATDDATVGVPSVADSCLAIGAIPGHTSEEGGLYDWIGSERAGEVRAYSARGPRIDGAPKPDVVAPDDPWTAIGAGPLFPADPSFFDVPEGARIVFSGTSGAGPHAAGILALLAEVGVRGDAASEAVRASAIADPIAGVIPSSAYGHGRVSAARALGGDDRSAPPIVRIDVRPVSPAPGDDVQVTPVLDGIGGEVRWDDGYDGTWDVEYEPPAPRTFTRDAPGVLRIKVRARNAAGLIAESAVRIVFAEAPPDAGPSDAGASDAATADAAARRFEHVKWDCGCSAPGVPAPKAPGSVVIGIAGWAWLACRRRRRARRGGADGAPIARTSGQASS